MISETARFGVTGRAIENGIVELGLWNPRDFARDKRQTVDDRPYGGGPGMVMMYQPLHDAIQAAKSAAPEAVTVAYLSPQGRSLRQEDFVRFAARERILMIAGRYEGVDQRLLQQHVEEEWSLGDYVISGGELAALVVIDGVSRLLPNVLGSEFSSQQDSFMHGLLDYPHYTRPDTVDGLVVPAVLQSGNHAAIERWRLKQALGRTWQLRPDLLNKLELSDLHNALLDEFINENMNLKRNGQ